MARAGTAKYDIEAEDKFSRVLAKAGGGFSSMQAKVVTANAAMQLGGAAADLFAGALDNLYGKSSGLIDRQAKVAAAIGVTTEYLEAAQYSAELNGVGADQLEKAYSKMNKAVSEASDGAAKYKRSLDELGLDAETLKLQSTEEQYAAISGAIGEVGNQADRLNLSQTFFGKQGAFLIKNTADQIDAGRKELDSFGISLSRLDSAKVEAANDAMFKLETISAGAKRELAAGLAPAIETIAENILGAAKGTTEFDVSAQKMGRNAIKVFGKVGTAVIAVDGAVKTVAIGFLGAERAFYKLQANLTFNEESAEAYRFKVQVVTAQMDKLAVAAKSAFKLDYDDRLLADFDRNIADAEARASKLNSDLSGGDNSGGSGGDTSSETESRRRSVNAQVLALEEQMATEEEKIGHSLQKRLELIAEFESLNTGKKREADILRDEAENEAIEKRRELREKEAAEIQKEVDAKVEKDQLHIESERLKQEKLTEIRRKATADAIKQEKEMQDKVIGYLDKGLGLAASKSRSAFEAQKAIDIGRALIAGKVAAVEAFRWGNTKGGLAVGVAAAGASLAYTGALIQSIDGRSFGGGADAASTEGDTSVTGGGDLSAVVNAGGDANVQFSFNIINPLGGIVDKDAFDELVMDSVEREIEAKGLTGKVDVNEIRLQVNRERAIAE